MTSLVPFVGNAGSITPMGGISGGPNFTVSSLNTQEFYSGIEAQIATQTVGLLLAQGVRAEVLLPLVIPEIVIEDGARAYSIRNEPDDRRRFTTAYAAILQLAKNGLSVAETKERTDVGPTLSSGEAKALLGDQIAAGAEARPGNKPLVLERVKGADRYVLRKDGSSWNFCFDVRARPHILHGSARITPWQSLAVRWNKCKCSLKWG